MLFSILKCINKEKINKIESINNENRKIIKKELRNIEEKTKKKLEKLVIKNVWLIILF